MVVGAACGAAVVVVAGASVVVLCGGEVVVLWGAVVDGATVVELSAGDSSTVVVVASVVVGREPPPGAVVVGATVVVLDATGRSAVAGSAGETHRTRTAARISTTTAAMHSRTARIATSIGDRPGGPLAASTGTVSCSLVAFAGSSVVTLTLAAVPR